MSKRLPTLSKIYIMIGYYNHSVSVEATIMVSKTASSLLNMLVPMAQYVTTATIQIVKNILNLSAYNSIDAIYSCQLTLTWMSNIKEVHVDYEARLHDSVSLLDGVWPPFCVSLLLSLSSLLCVHAHGQYC